MLRQNWKCKRFIGGKSCERKIGAQVVRDCLPMAVQVCPVEGQEGMEEEWVGPQSAAHSEKFLARPVVEPWNKTCSLKEDCDGSALTRISHW